MTAYPPPGATDAEVFYNRFDPFFWSWVVSLAATVCLLSAVGALRRSMFWLGVALLLVAQAFTAAGLGLRGYVTGLVPLTGMFETVVFVALYAALLGLWFALLPLCWSSGQTAVRPGGSGRMDRVLQRRLFAVAGAMVSFLAAVLAYYAPSTVMHRNLGSVAPILRDNFWLAVHVVTIMAGYASAAIALILGNIALGYYLLGRYAAPSPSLPQMPDTASGGRATRRPPEACATLAGFTYTAIQIAVLLLTAGTILGRALGRQGLGPLLGLGPEGSLGPDLAAGVSGFSPYAAYRLARRFRHGHDGRAGSQCGRLYLVRGELLVGQRHALLRLRSRRAVAGRHGRGGRIAVPHGRRGAISGRNRG